MVRSPIPRSPDPSLSHSQNPWNGLALGAARRRLSMATQVFTAPGLKMELEEGPVETIVRCTGKITAECAEKFQTEIRDRVIPMTRGKGVDVTQRVLVDLSGVSYIDSVGLGALLGIWTAGQRRGCDLEITNLSPRVEKLVS